MCAVAGTRTRIRLCPKNDTFEMVILSPPLMPTGEATNQPRLVLGNGGRGPGRAADIYGVHVVAVRLG